jgi:UDP-N-acetylglucosamine--N-acetylmuramyl-(pentapeptide) pyrophosphoryl-undecaprenol N-acetylglucosamine transferase
MQSSDTTYRVLMAAGGTGGHVYPAISIADAIRQARPSAEVHFAGTSSHMEWTAVPKAGYPIHSIWISGFHRRFTLQNLLFPVKLLVSLIQSWLIIRRIRPHVVISCGGYVSGPVGRVASIMGIPLMVQEQNSFPGVTNRLLGEKATFIFTAFPEAASFFESDKVREEGNPVRNDISRGDREKTARKVGFDPSRKTLLVMGGSGGAANLNQAMLTNLDELHNELELQIIWQCGRRYLSEMRQKVAEHKFPNLYMTDFLEDMPGVYALSDLVVCRSGAGTIAELLVCGKPSILVPSPVVAGDHQRKNAASVVGRGAAVMIEDNELADRIVEVVDELLSESGRLAAMQDAALALARPDAARTIASTIIRETHPNEILPSHE